jgi:hypothetical protein
VIPAMMLVLLYNVTAWTFIAGILKEWTFCVIFFAFITMFLVHKVLFQISIILHKQKHFAKEALFLVRN